MKKVLFDGTAIQPSTKASFHGGSEYAKCVLREILNQGKNIDIIFYNNLPIPPDIMATLDSHHIKTHYTASKNDLYKFIDLEGYDLFYSPLPYAYYDYNGNTTIIGVIHGLRTIEFPWDRYYHKFINTPVKKFIGRIISYTPFLWQILKKRNISKFSKLLLNPKFKFITVSEHSKYSLVKFYPSLNEKDIEVCYSPLDTISHEKVETRNNVEKYFLLVSGNRAEKNIIRAVSALDNLFTKGLLTTYKVKITGVTNPKIFSHIKNSEKFEFLPYISSAELNKLYRNAFCFIYPSLNEGFGYPPLQAMACHIPVIASSATSIPEVCGNAALYFSPTNIDDLENRILQIALNSQIRESLIESGNKRLEEIKFRQKKDLEKLINLIFK